MLTTTGFRTPVFEAKTNKQKVYIYIYTHTPFICAILQHQNITHRIHGTEIFSYINHRFMGIFMSVNSSLPRRPMVFMKTEASSLGRGVPWMSWVGSMKSTPQGCTGGRGLSGWMDFFLQASNQGSTSRNSWDPQDSNLGGSRLVTFFFVFLLPLNTFRVYFNIHRPFPPKNPQKGHQNNWNRGTLLFFPELARGRYASETCLFFFLKLISQKSRRPLKE